MPISQIAVIAFDGISPFHLSAPCAVFMGQGRPSEFVLRVCSIDGAALQSSAGFQIVVDAGLELLDEADIIIMPSWRDVHEAAPERLIHALQTAQRRGAQIVGLCLGAFVLAQAGLLDGQAATTHWHWAAEFARQFPQITLQADVLYVDNGQIVTSAGTAASIDCCLHLLRQRVGSARANHVARMMVVAPHRQGGQAQFIEHAIADSQGELRLQSTLQWAQSQLATPLNLDQLAAHACMSRRTFSRKFRQSTGASFGEWLLRQRLQHAQTLLETTAQTMDGIASQAGFASAITMRQHFVKYLAISPSQYRKNFSALAKSAA